MSKLPADVRLRAATAGWTAWVENSSDEELAWRAVADAVAEVVKPEHQREMLKQLGELAAALIEVIFERDALKARVAELEAENERLREERDGIVRARASEHKEMHRAGEDIRRLVTENEALRARIAEMEEHERERLAQAQIHYSDAWSSYDRILRRMGNAVNVPLPGDLRYYEYEQRVVEKAVALADEVAASKDAKNDP